MAKTRFTLEEYFRAMSGPPAIYFQAPSSEKMKYPCIVYQHTRTRPHFADNRVYGKSHYWLVTLIYRDPDSPLPDELASIPGCIEDRAYCVDNLYHNVYTINH